MQDLHIVLYYLDSCVPRTRLTAVMLGLMHLTGELQLHAACWAAGPDNLFTLHSSGIASCKQA